MTGGRWYALMLCGLLGLAGCATVPQKMGTLMEQGQYAQAIALGEGAPSSPEIENLLQRARLDQSQAYARWSTEGATLEQKGDLEGALAAWQNALAAQSSPVGQAALQRVRGKLHEDRENRLFATQSALLKGYRQALAAHPPKDVASSIQTNLDQLTHTILTHAQALQTSGDGEGARRFWALISETPEAAEGLAQMQNKERRDLLSHPLAPSTPHKVRVGPGEPLKNLPRLPSAKDAALEELKGLQDKEDLPGIRQWLDRHGNQGWLENGAQRALEGQLTATAAKLMARADAAFLAEDLSGAITLARRAVALDPSPPQNQKRLKEWEGMLENLQRLQGASP